MHDEVAVLRGWGMLGTTLRVAHSFPVWRGERPITLKMIERLVEALVQSKNESADIVLLEAMEVGNEREQRTALRALIRRQTVRGLCGVIAMYDALRESLQ